MPKLYRTKKVKYETCILVNQCYPAQWCELLRIASQSHPWIPKTNPIIWTIIFTLHLGLILLRVTIKSNNVQCCFNLHLGLILLMVTISSFATPFFNFFFFCFFLYCGITVIGMEILELVSLSCFYVVWTLKSYVTMLRS